jgi:ribosome modulation factor
MNVVKLPPIAPPKNPSDEGWNAYVRDCEDAGPGLKTFEQSQATCPYPLWRFLSRAKWFDGWHEAREFDAQENG